MNALREGLPPLPSRMQTLKLDHRGYPVPWFVAWIDGKPDFRVMDGAKIPIAVHQRRCWLCGDKLGKYMTFCLGPDVRDQSHDLGAAIASRMHGVQRQGVPVSFDAEGQAARNESARGQPRVCGLRSYRVFRAGTEGGSRDGILFRVGDPVSIAWYAEGREATRAEVLASINGGLPHLQSIATEQGPKAVAALEHHVQRAMPLLPAD